jgi:hypothetical protein
MVEVQRPGVDAGNAELQKATTALGNWQSVGRTLPLARVDVTAIGHEARV